MQFSIIWMSDGTRDACRTSECRRDIRETCIKPDPSGRRIDERPSEREETNVTIIDQSMYHH